MKKLGALARRRLDRAAHPRPQLELDDYFDFTIESTVAADDLAGGGER